MALPKAIIEALAGRIASKMQAGLSASVRMPERVADDPTSRTPVVTRAKSEPESEGILGRMAALLTRFERKSQQPDRQKTKRSSGGWWGQQKPQTWSQLAEAAKVRGATVNQPYRPGWLDRLDAWMHPDEVDQPTKTGPAAAPTVGMSRRPGAAPGFRNRVAGPRAMGGQQRSLIDAATRQAGKDQAKAGQAWWSRGWGNKPTATGARPSARSRAARLTVMAQRRYQAADRAVKASNAAKKSGRGWHPAAHGQALAARNAAAQKLAQATQLQAKTTLVGSAASGRVAAGLMTLAKGLPQLASKLALPASAAVAVAKVPWQIKAMNDDRIQTMREGAKYNGGVAAAIARYDAKTENLKALNARDTASSTGWLVTEQNRLRTTLRPLESMATNAMNNVMAGGTRILNDQALAFENNVAAMTGASQMLFDSLSKGRLPSLKDIGDAAMQGVKDKDAQKIENEKVQSNQFGQHLGGWAQTMANKQDARFNNKPRKSCRW